MEGKEGGLKGERGEEFHIKPSNKQTNMKSSHFYLWNVIPSMLTSCDLHAWNLLSYMW
jgi:hypothetical protein